MTNQIELIFIFCTICVIFDLKTQKIPNLLIVGFLVIGIVSNIYLDGFSNIIFYLIGWIVPFALLLPIYILKGIGAGDVKMIMAIGTVSQFKDLMLIMALSFIFAGVYGVFFIMTKNKRGILEIITAIKFTIIFRIPLSHTICGIKLNRFVYSPVVYLACVVVFKSPFKNILINL